MDEVRNEMYKVSAKLINDLEGIVNKLDSSNESLDEIYNYMFEVYSKMARFFTKHPDDELLRQIEQYQTLMRIVKRLQVDASTV